MVEPQKDKKKRSLFLLFLGLFLIGSIIYFIYTVNPHALLPRPLPPTVTPLIVFFVLFFLSITALVGYIGNSIRRGIFFAIFLCSYLLLRLNHFTDTYFFLILLGLYISLEGFFTRYR